LKPSKSSQKQYGQYGQETQPMPIVIPPKENDHGLVGYFDVNRRTIERWFDNWVQTGINTLAIQPGRGVKTRLKGHKKEIEEQLKKHNRNLKNVLTYLEGKHNNNNLQKDFAEFFT
jgi:hypothetical protein